MAGNLKSPPHDLQRETSSKRAAKPVIFAASIALVACAAGMQLAAPVALADPAGLAKTMLHHAARAVYDAPSLAGNFLALIAFTASFLMPPIKRETTAQNTPVMPVGAKSPSQEGRQS